MYTEEEAKKKWCPHVRVSDGENYASENRVCHAGKVIRGDDASWCNCIASDCMMWRWVIYPPINDKSTGYCGFSVKPF